MAHHYKLSDPWGVSKGAQPDVTSDKQHKAPPKHILSSPPRGCVELLSPTFEDTTCHANGQSTHNWLSPTSSKDLKSIKTGTWKPSLEELPNLKPDGQVDGPEPLFFPQEGTHVSLRTHFKALNY